MTTLFRCASFSAQLTANCRELESVLPAIAPCLSHLMLYSISQALTGCVCAVYDTNTEYYIQKCVIWWTYICALQEASPTSWPMTRYIHWKEKDTPRRAEERPRSKPEAVPRFPREGTNLSQWTIGTMSFLAGTYMSQWFKQFWPVKWQWKASTRLFDYWPEASPLSKYDVKQVNAFMCCVNQDL